MSERAVVRFDSLRALIDQDSLAALFGPIRTFTRTPLQTVGYSAATHERIHLTLGDGRARRFVVKRANLAIDWTAIRSGDRTGREARMLGEPGLAGIWDPIECPYVAFAVEGREIGLLMNDLSSWLYPDTRKALQTAREDPLLDALAGLHAKYWNTSVTLPWLVSTDRMAGLVDVSLSREGTAVACVPAQLRASIVRGWALVLERVSGKVRDMLTSPTKSLHSYWKGLPRTLIHGDPKVANFALLENGRIAGFDWALLGLGPASTDLGWYLAINGSRLSRSRGATLDRYRELLQKHLAGALPDATWNGLRRAAIVLGARMLLWSKALSVENGRAGAVEEWNWWVERLEAEM